MGNFLYIIAQAQFILFILLLQLVYSTRVIGMNERYPSRARAGLAHGLISRNPDRFSYYNSHIAMPRIHSGTHKAFIPNVQATVIIVYRI